MQILKDEKAVNESGNSCSCFLSPVSLSTLPYNHIEQNHIGSDKLLFERLSTVDMTVI